MSSQNKKLKTLHKIHINASNQIRLIQSCIREAENDPEITVKVKHQEQEYSFSNREVIHLLNIILKDQRTRSLYASHMLRASQAA